MCIGSANPISNFFHSCMVGAVTSTAIAGIVTLTASVAAGIFGITSGTGIVCAGVALYAGYVTFLGISTTIASFIFYIFSRSLTMCF